MFTPTKEQLEELGFEKFPLSDNYHIVFYGEYHLIWKPASWYRKELKSMWTLFRVPIYPESKEDIWNLIRLLTPQ